MTEVTMTAADAESTLVRLATCAERAGKLETMKLLLQLGVSLDAVQKVEVIAAEAK